MIRWLKHSLLNFAQRKHKQQYDLLSEREAHYEKYLGPLTEQVMHSTDVKAVHVDIYTFPPSKDRPFYTLITGGMSDERMTIPTEIEVSPRAEVMLYVTEPKSWMYSVLKGLAEAPSEHQTFFSYLHTVPNGKPMTATLSELTSFVFAPPLMEANDFSPMTVAGDPTDILLVLPITEGERQFAMEEGSDKLIERLIDAGPPIVDEDRRSVV